MIELGMASKPLHRHSASKTKMAKDELQNRHIRFDYSDTYMDNDDLDIDLEDQEYQLRREQFRKAVESEKNYKKVKQNADEMLQLKNALKNRDPNETSKRISKSADLNRRSSNSRSQMGHASTCNGVNINKEVGESIDNNIETEVFIDGHKDEVDSKPKTRTNNLTMFLLSLQKLKGLGFRQNLEKQTQQDKKEDAKDDRFTNQTYTRSMERQDILGRPSSFKSVIQSVVSQRNKGESDPKSRASSQYGIHVKRDFTRSRRELEEISRIEQDGKYGYVNKYEERRKRLLDSCKNTDNLKQRINLFLKDVDEFKRETCNVKSTDKVIFRSKSAQLSRTQNSF